MTKQIHLLTNNLSFLRAQVVLFSLIECSCRLSPILYQTTEEWYPLDPVILEKRNY